MKSVTFQDKKQMSEGVSSRMDVAQIVLECIPLATRVEKADLSDDKNGTDYWAFLFSGHKLSIDVKVRGVDWCRNHPKEDDLALETWSVVGQKVGWTRDTNKRTDYVLWVWLDTGRWTCIPFPMLCDIFGKSWEDWRKKYKTRSQHTENQNGTAWESECVFVPRQLLWNKIYATFGGVPV